MRRATLTTVCTLTVLLLGGLPLSGASSHQSPVAKIVPSFADRPTGQDGRHYVCNTESLRFSGEASYDPDGHKLHKFAWTVNGGGYPTGPNTSSNVTSISFTANSAGEHVVGLQVTDAHGMQGRTELRFVSYDCRNQSPPPTAPTSSPSQPCGPDGYYNQQTGKCEYAAQPTTSPQPAYTSDPERCRSLQAERQSFENDWHYQYKRHYEQKGTQPGSDAQFERDMAARRDAFMNDWAARWKNAGCDYSQPEPYPDACREKFQKAEPEMSALRTRYEGLWKQYYQDLEQARRDFGSQSRTEAEWREFETKWRQRSDELHKQMASEMEAIAAKYGLRECGYHSQPPPGAQPQPVYPSEPPQAAPAYVAARNECESKMIEVKNRYQARFEELYNRLRQQAPDSAEYAQTRSEISQLEQQVRSEMEALMASCRDQYVQDYERPEDFRDGIGSLQCYFDQAEGSIRCEGKYVSFRGDPNTQTLSRYTCGGQLFFDRMFSNRVFEDFQFGESGEGSALNIRSSSLRMSIHDGPRGVIKAGVVGDAELYFVPATHLRVTQDGNKILVEGAGTTGAWLGGPGALVWDEFKRVITVKTEGTWVAESCLPDGSKPDGARDPAYWQAIRDRKLGAQVVISVGGTAVEQDNETYSDMRVHVTREDARRFTAIVDSDEDLCKTVVLKFNAGIFASIDLKVVITDDAGNRLEVRESSSMEDILEPCDDGPDTFEYWIVQDKHGTQVLVSFAHFSEKRVSVEAANLGNIQVPGFEWTLLVLAAVGVLGLRRRRA